MIQKKWKNIKRKKKDLKRRSKNTARWPLHAGNYSGWSTTCMLSSTHYFFSADIDEDIHRPINAFVQTLLLVLYVKLRGRKSFYGQYIWNVQVHNTHNHVAIFWLLIQSTWAMPYPLLYALDLNFCCLSGDLTNSSFVSLTAQGRLPIDAKSVSHDDFSSVFKIFNLILSWNLFFFNRHPLLK